MPGRHFEPAPLAFLSRQSFHPWLVVGVTCIGAFIGQVDASIVQLALPTLQATAFRTLQGIGGSLLAANSIAILVKSVPSDQRAHAIGYFTAAQAIGVSVGPGGLLLASVGWQWVFWVSVPF